MDKVSCELFCFTYGAMVSQLLRQYKDAAEVTSLAILIIIIETGILSCTRLNFVDL